MREWCWRRVLLRGVRTLCTRQRLQLQWRLRGGLGNGVASGLILSRSERLQQPVHAATPLNMPPLSHRLPPLAHASCEEQVSLHCERLSARRWPWSLQLRPSIREGMQGHPQQLLRPPDPREQLLFHYSGGCLLIDLTAHGKQEAHSGGWRQWGCNLTDRTGFLVGSDSRKFEPETESRTATGRAPLRSSAGAREDLHSDSSGAIGVCHFVSAVSTERVYSDSSGAMRVCHFVSAVSASITCSSEPFSTRHHVQSSVWTVPQSLPLSSSSPG